MTTLLRCQPFRGLYLLLELVRTALLRVPFWVLVAACGWRPRSSWSIKRSVYFKLFRLSLDLAGKFGPFRKPLDHRALAPEKPGIAGVWVKPTPELVTGHLKTWTYATGVAPANIPGYWSQETNKTTDPARPAAPGEKVILFLHGGGYVRLSAHPSDPTGAIPRGILQHSHSIHRCFAVEYRLSSIAPAANPFPAALLDALAGYNHLVCVAGFLPENVVVVGDSAGGNLAHALVRYLIEYLDVADITLPRPPGHLVLLSPWTDIGDSLDHPGTSAVNFRENDFIDTKGTVFARNAFLGRLGLGAALRNSYISPASLDPGFSINFKGFPRTFIVSGGAEVLHDQIVTLKDRMIKDLGDLVTYYEAKDAFHDYLVFDWYEPERTDTLVSLAQWLDV